MDHLPNAMSAASSMLQQSSAAQTAFTKSMAVCEQPRIAAASSLLQHRAYLPRGRRVQKPTRPHSQPAAAAVLPEVGKPAECPECCSSWGTTLTMTILEKSPGKAKQPSLHGTHLRRPGPL